jgi:hypothetical protein
MSSVAAAQQPLPPPPLPVDPTPLAELITEQERQKLAQATQPKKQVEALLRIADDHLETAYKSIKAKDSAKSERELDIYNKAMAESARIAFEQQKTRRSLSKKVEQRLYKQIKVLGEIERLFPIERGVFAEDAIKQAKQLRVQALNKAFDSGPVLDELDDEDDNKSKVPSTPRTPPPGILDRRLLVASNSQRPASTIPGDYLNEEEDDHVREAQSPDDRIKVFMKIADRRLLVLTGGATPAPEDKKAQKKAEEEAREWGPLPTAGRTELFKHYSRAIEEAIAKLEDAYERNPKSTAIPKALTLLRDATDRHLVTLRSLESQANEKDENDALKGAIEQATVANNGAKEGLKSK